MSSARAFYLKFDLTNASLKEIPALESIFRREGAARACLLLEAVGGWPSASLLPVASTDEAQWNVIKIPSLDGTELWIVPASAQTGVETKLGFQKNSRPVVSLAATELRARSYKDPLHRQEVHLDWRMTGTLQSRSGLAMMIDQTGFAPDQLDRARDSGSIAFEEVYS